MKVKQPSVDGVIKINQLVCYEGGNTHLLFDRNKVESALHSAFYPGTYPFVHGGVAGMAGALTFYLTQAHAFQDGNKRTAAITGSTFMSMNGWSLNYAVDLNTDRNDFAEIILKCASGKAPKEEVMEWFENHKTILVSTDGED